MKKSALALVALLAACGGGGTMSPRPVVAFYGDSTVSGHYNTGPAPGTLVQLSPKPVARVATATGLTCFDYGNPGESVTTFSLRTDASTAAVLGYGMADAVMGTAPEAFRLALLKAIVKLDGRRVILRGVPRLYVFSRDGWNPTRQLVDRATLMNNIVAEVADAMGLEFIDVRGLDSEPTDIIDGIHPSPAFAQRMVDLIAGYLRTP